jgi:hypothetical protein
MCLIERLPAKTINFPLAACCGPNGITYFGGETVFEPIKKKSRRAGKRHNRKPATVTAMPKKAPKLAFVALEADMGLPARDSSSEREPCRITSEQLTKREARNTTTITLSQGTGVDVGSDYHPCCRYTTAKVIRKIHHRSHGVHGKKKAGNKKAFLADKHFGLRQLAATQFGLQ